MIKIYDQITKTGHYSLSYLFGITDISYNFWEDSNKLYASIRITYNDESIDSNELTIDIDKKLYAGKIIMLELFKVGFNNFKGFQEIVASVKYGKVGGKIDSVKSKNILKAASIWIPKNYEEDKILILPHYKVTDEGTRISGAEYEETALINDSPQLTLLSKSEDATEVRAKWLLKLRLIDNLIDGYSSISYLEGQIDVLYKIINMLIEKTGLDVSEYQDILDAVNETSVLNIKPLEKLKKELYTDKENVRQVQKTYYNSISK